MQHPIILSYRHIQVKPLKTARLVHGADCAKRGRHGVYPHVVREQAVEVFDIARFAYHVQRDRDALIRVAFDDVLHGRDGAVDDFFLVAAGDEAD